MLLLLLACATDPADSAGSPATAEWRACPLALPSGPPEEADAWYRCVDGHLQGGAGCGPDGYLLGFGGKYARKYMLEVRPNLSEAGQAFLDHNLTCLEEALSAGMEAEPRCEDVSTLGFASHVPCYVESGFCELPLDDVLLIATAVEPEDQGLPEQAEAVAGIQAACAER